MNKDRPNYKALTLIELLVSTALIAIVMLGSMSVDYAIRSAQQNASRTSALYSETSAALMSIVNDGLMAVGNPAFPGIDYDETDAVDQHICFRHDVDNDPANFANDRWVCYTSEAGVIGIRNIWHIWRCDQLINPVQSCPTAGTGRIIIQEFIRNGYLGGGASDNNHFFQVILNASNQLERIDVFLTSRVDTTQNAHPINNPEFTVNSSVNPPGISR